MKVKRVKELLESLLILISSFHNLVEVTYHRKGQRLGGSNVLKERESPLFRQLPSYLRYKAYLYQPACLRYNYFTFFKRRLHLEPIHLYFMIVVGFM